MTRHKKSEKIIPDNVFAEIEADNFNEEDLKKLVDRVVESIWSQNRNLFDFYEQMVNEVDNLRIELANAENELSTLIPYVDKMRKNEQGLRNSLADVTSRFRHGEESKVYMYLLEAKEELRQKEAEEAGLRKKRDLLQLKLKRFQNMEKIAKTMVSTIGSLATFLGETFSSVVTNVEIMKDELEVNEKIINAHETERLRISRELHDTVAQDLSSLLFDASLCKMAIERDEKEQAIEGLDKIKDGIRGGISGVRQAIFDMRPMSIDDLGLIGAIKELAQSTSSRYGIPIKVRIDGNDEVGRGIIPSFKEMAVYRIVQEAFNNIVHHSGATLVETAIQAARQNLTITIRDNGKGFDAKAVLTANEAETDSDSKHYGLLGMFERARQIGAEFTIDSNIGKGAVTRIRLPLG